jgi:hypothetical protein
VKKNCTGNLADDNYASSWLKYITQTFKLPSIKAEILLLQSCHNELNRIQQQDPNNYIYSIRYKSILQTLDLLKTCNTSEIQNLSWQRTEIQNSNIRNTNTPTTFFIPTIYTSNIPSSRIRAIRKVDGYTVIELSAFPSKRDSNGWYFSFNPSAYIEQNGLKYYLKKVDYITLSPKKDYRSVDTEINFKLFFDQSINFDYKFNIIETANSITAFNFINISK